MGRPLSLSTAGPAVLEARPNGFAPIVWASELGTSAFRLLRLLGSFSGPRQQTLVRQEFLHD